MTTFMEGETSWESYSVSCTSWESHSMGYHSVRVVALETTSDTTDGNEVGEAIFWESLLPNEILEKIFSYMPIACIIRMASVSKRWYEIVYSSRSSWSSTLPQKPWYFMFTRSDSTEGHAYDPSLRKWHSIALPYMDSRNCSVSSSFGLVCYMDNDNRSTIFISNPITKECRRLLGPPGGNFPDYCALAMFTNTTSQRYNIAVVKSKQVPDDFLQWEFSIHLYESETRTWVTSIKEVLVGWRAGDESVICNGVLYCLIYATGIAGNADRRHGLIMYDHSVQSHQKSIMQTSILVPCSLTCGRLMNLKERLVMVGGIGKPDRQDIIKGIGIWELCGKEWREMARMPNKFFQGFGEFDDVFASSGTDDLIYIQSYGAPALLIYDVALGQWRWSIKCPVTKRFPLQLFTGFCFEPRLEAAAV